MKRLGLAVVCAVAIALAVAGTAQASFPYLPSGGSASDYSTYRSGPGVVPDDLTGSGNDWKFAATPEAGAPASITGSSKELNGVRGAHLVDADSAAHTAWETTTGRPDVAIAVLDSGIEWNNAGAMKDLRYKVRLNRGELPAPQIDGPTLDAANATCSSYSTNNSDRYDVNGDSVFNALDYACDPRVTTSSGPRVGPAGTLTPQDVIIAFSDGSDGDGNGYKDDIAGWDFLDDDNDPYDDVQYGHGTGEATDSSAEANNGGDTGTCPNCMVVPLRVGDSFVADVNRFAQATLYAVDNNVLVVQEALGTLNNSALARKAVDYAYRHGVAVMASAADEAAQHHNWPSSLPHTIVTNSVRKYDSTFTPADKSYVEFNGCTNFSSKVTLSIPSSSCSSNAVGLAAGMAGLIYSAAMNSHHAGNLAPSTSSSCVRPGGGACLITPNEVRQLIASGKIAPGNPHAGNPSDTEGTQADDINFVSGTEPSCSGIPSVDCTDPNRFFPIANAPVTGRPVLSVTSPFVTRSYPAHKGFDQYYGYGRANMVKAVEATTDATMPPEAEITAPEWYEQIDSTRPNVDVEGSVYARGHDYKCTVEVAPGSDPTNDADFQQITTPSWCDGQTVHSAEHQGALAQVSIPALRDMFPQGTDFTGAAPTALTNTETDGPHQNNRPAREPYGFTVRVRVTSTHDGNTLMGQDRRNMYLHRDKDLKPGFPRQFPSDGASSPVLVDIDGDDRNEMVFGTSDGRVHALKPDGSEAAGFPVHTDPLALHTGQPAFKDGEVPEGTSFGAILSSVAVGDIDHDGVPEVVAADLEGKVYVWNANGDLEWKRQANPDYSGKPLVPFHNVRCPVRCRTQHGFIASPVLANLDGSADGKLDVIAAGMDRHVYAWHADGGAVDGYPVLVVDRTKVQSIDPQTHAVTFLPNIGDALNQGAIVDTPAVGDLTGNDGKLEIVVGTNEEYPASDDGGLNASVSSGTLALIAQAGGSLGLAPANSRIYAIKSTGDPGATPSMDNSDVFIGGWPKKVGVLLAELLPVVGEGITGSPVIGSFTCPSGGDGNKVGTIPGAGPGYIFNADGSSCYGQEQGGADRALANDGQGLSAQGPKYDTPIVPAVGHPAFGRLDPAGSVSFLAPAAGLIRALDLAFPEYQGGQDFSVAWNTNSGQFEAGWPVPVNDLSFLTGPSVADVDGQPGEEAVGGTASLDLNALNFAGQPVAGFPKLSSDWMVTNPVIGSFGTLDVDADAHNVIGTMTRRGTLFAYDTPAPVCPLGSWPRFHHDNANSGVLERDAVAPGRPFDVSLGAAGVSFRAPGDDLLCGQATRYEAVQSDAPITPASFASADALTAPAVAAAGATVTLALPAGTKRYVAIRAVDDQGNVGRPAIVDRTPDAGSGSGSGSGSGGSGSGAGGSTGGGTSNGPGETPGGGGGVGAGGGSAGCRDKSAPRSSISRRALRASGRAIRVRGSARDRGCAGLKREYVSIALVHGTRCRFLTKRGKLSAVRRCRRPVLIRTRGTKRWSARVSGRLRHGKYRLVARGVDRKGNKERPRRGNSMHFRVR